MHYYPHHIGDFISDTARLSDSQCMAYLRLIWHYYDTEQPLENNPESLAFKVGANLSDVNLILKHYFVLDGDVWRKTRCDNVIGEYHSKADKARKSADSRWKNAKAKRTNSECNANASDNNANASKMYANQEPITNNQLKDIPPQADESEKVISDKPIAEKKSRATRLPNDWIPSQEYFDELANIDEKLKSKFNSIAATFKDYWVAKSGKDATKTDWLATWRNWVRREAEKNAKNNGGATSNYHDRRADLTNAVTDYERATNF